MLYGIPLQFIVVVIAAILIGYSQIFSIKCNAAVHRMVKSDIFPLLNAATQDVEQIASTVSKDINDIINEYIAYSALYSSLSTFVVASFTLSPPLIPALCVIFSILLGFYIKNETRQLNKFPEERRKKRLSKLFSAVSWVLGGLLILLAFISYFLKSN